MDVRAKNCGRLHKNVFYCGPGDGEKLFGPWASRRKGQERPQQIWTEKCMFMLFFFTEQRLTLYPKHLDTTRGKLANA